MSIKHIAFIMDGNGRWAKKRLFPRASGHKEGLKTIERITNCARERGIKFVSFFAFSTENWSRPKSEVDSLMQLMRENLPKMSQKIDDLGAKLVFSGNIDAFDAEFRKLIGDINAKNCNKSDEKMMVNICLNYGGRNDIVNAANRAIRQGKLVSEEEFSRLLYTADLPDPDLLIRTGGEMRISNFMLFQIAYTELYFSEKLWPDFDDGDLNEAIKNFESRQRRFGKL